MPRYKIKNEKKSILCVPLSLKFWVLNRVFIFLFIYLYDFFDVQNCLFATKFY